jgi:hypothetical protein
MSDLLGQPPLIAAVGHLDVSVVVACGVGDTRSLAPRDDATPSNEDNAARLMIAVVVETSKRTVGERTAVGSISPMRLVSAGEY